MISFFTKIVPDSRDPAQTTTVRPGLRLEVIEQGGNVGIGLSPIHAVSSIPHEIRMGIIDVAAAEELVAALQQAIDLAKQRGRAAGSP